MAGDGVEGTEEGSKRGQSELSTSLAKHNTTQRSPQAAAFSRTTEPLPTFSPPHLHNGSGILLHISLGRLTLPS
ncbi:hypothetical protein Pmani_017768 [Petrolisthes manimaculis]|uniref:Uncharacterized protein n=1 Tax=Petrolisthes manimaculis TaxID=1843537 RepID=A0AAE1PNV8_9EUCA|nr:hypothetical protein Pmani_017768 [Petrolisthes manimaculis]